MCIIFICLILMIIHWHNVQRFEMAYFLLGVAPSLFSAVCFMLNYDALLGMRLRYLGQPSKTWCNNLRWFCTYVKPLQNLFGLTTANEDRGVQLFALKPLNSFQCSLFYNFLKHHFAWEAAGNTDNDTKKIFIIFMTKKKKKIYKWGTSHPIKQIISLH